MPMKVKVVKTGRLKTPKLDQGQLTKIGEEMVRAQKLRWGNAINADGASAKKLTQRAYNQKRKLRKSSSPRRDMELTGLTKQNFTLRKAIDGVIRAENSSREARRRARRADQYEQMIGFAPTDQRIVFQGAAQAYKLYVQKGWQEINVSG